MARESKFDHPIDKEIYELHRRFIMVMEDHRLGTISIETKEKYVLILRNLTEKLSLPSKPLGEIVGEMMAEAAPLLFQAMQR